MTDSDIISLLRDKQVNKAYTKLYAYYSKVEKHILSNSGTKPDAQDIYQEALIVLYKKCQNPEFKLTSALNTYIYGISKFLWSNELRKRSGRTTSDVAEIDLTGDYSDIETISEEQSKLKLAESALQQVGKKCLQILTLFYYQSMSIKEIAKKMGHSTEASAKNAKYKCLQRVKAKLNSANQTETVNA